MRIFLYPVLPISGFLCIETGVLKIVTVSVLFHLNILNTRNIVKKAKKCNNKDLIFETESFPSFEIDTKSSMAKTMRPKKISVNFIKQNND